jgi:hypothetical protein
MQYVPTLAASKLVESFREFVCSFVPPYEQERTIRRERCGGTSFWSVVSTKEQPIIIIIIVIVTSINHFCGANAFGALPSHAHASATARKGIIHQWRRKKNPKWMGNSLQTQSRSFTVADQNYNNHHPDNKSNAMHAKKNEHINWRTKDIPNEDHPGLIGFDRSID